LYLDDFSFSMRKNGNEIIEVEVS
jgi:hypothetical protein